jgi:signal transduction histidine kinase
MTWVIFFCDPGHATTLSSSLSRSTGLWYDQAMKPSREVEPGLLPTFRLFIGVQLAITALDVITHWLVAPFPRRSAVVTLAVFSLLSPGLLFLYLSMPALPRTLKSMYLPIAIVWAAAGAVAGPFLDPYVTLINLHATSNTAPELPAQVLLWRQTILLLIPLVVLSWQYAMRQVVVFCALTAVLNIALVSRIMVLEEMILRSLLGTIVVQTIIFFLVGQMIVKLMSVQRSQRQRLKEANERLALYASTLEQLTISRERNRLARELHDVLAHTLSGVAVELEGLRAMLRLDVERANALLSHALHAIREGLSESRRAVQELRAQPLEDLGLALAVRALAESYATRFDFGIELHIDPDLGDYGAEVEQCVYRIAQEALNNIAEHAQAHNAQLVLKRDRDHLRLIIRDDGCGFDPNLGAEEYQYGLLGMRERSEMIGGCLAVTSQVGKGTQVSFSYGGNQ